MEEQATDLDYVKGFNEGNLMARHMPELAAKLAPSLKDSSRGLGFKDGRQEFLFEQKRDKYPAWRKADWISKSNQPTIEDKSKDLEKEIDGPELEL